MNEETMVLTEDEAIELFTFLITSARTQLEDPCQYASMRLLTAAEFLRDFILKRTSTEATKLLNETVEKSLFAQTHTNDSVNYRATLDELCRLVAHYLVEQSGLNNGGLNE